MRRMELYLGRIRDDRGSVGVLVALVMFVVMGMLMMTWNTAQLSKEKMRLQNAVDSAALAHATWQARGMNVVQNLNEEKYLACDLGATLLNAGAGIELGAQAAYAASLAATAFPVAAGILKATAYGLRIIAIVAACTGSYLVHILCTVLNLFQHIFLWAAPISGLINAENFAVFNGATALGTVSIPTGIGDTIMFSAATVPLTSKFMELIRLPVVTTNKISKSPWVPSTVFQGIRSAFSGGAFQGGGLPKVYKFFNCQEDWEVVPFESQKKNGKAVLPSPVIWLAMRYGGHVEALPLDVITGEDTDKLDKHFPIFAVAAGKCVTGDIVPHVDNKQAKQRPMGFGTGATAKLVPVSDAVGADFNKTLGNVLGGLVFH